MTVEGAAGSVELGPDYRISVTGSGRTESWRVPPPTYAWADPAYGLVHSSIVDCNADILRALHRGAPAETTAADNLRTVELFYRADESAAAGQAVPPQD